MGHYADEVVAAAARVRAFSDESGIDWLRDDVNEAYRAAGHPAYEVDEEVEEDA